MVSVARASAAGLCPEAHEATVSIVPVRLPYRLLSGLHQIDTVWTVLLQLQGSNECGIGYAFAFEEQEARAITAEVEALIDFAMIPNLGIRETWRRMWRHINHIGQAGPPLIALSMIDAALWDAAAKCAGLSLHHLLGGENTRFPLYGSGGWLTYSMDELLQEAHDFAVAGYGGYKLKIGSPDWKRDLERVTRVVGAVGDQIEVMVDVNQSWTPVESISRIDTLLGLGVNWIEEPVDAFDLRGLAQIRLHSAAKLVAGETLTLVGCIENLIHTRGSGCCHAGFDALWRTDRPE